MVGFLQQPQAQARGKAKICSSFYSAPVPCELSGSRSYPRPRNTMFSTEESMFVKVVRHESRQDIRTGHLYPCVGFIEFCYVATTMPSKVENKMINYGSLTSRS